MLIKILQGNDSYMMLKNAFSCAWTECMRPLTLNHSILYIDNDRFFLYSGEIKTRIITLKEDICLKNKTFLNTFQFSSFSDLKQVILWGVFIIFANNMTVILYLYLCAFY